VLGQLVATGLTVNRLLGGVDASRLGEYLGGDLLVAAAGVVARRSRELGSVDGEHAHLDETGVGAKPEHLAEELGERRLVAHPKARDRRVVGKLVGADHPEGDVLATTALDAPR